jgi:hypothetical protein
MGAVPRALVPYVVEHEVNAPSLRTVRLRSQLLSRERRRAYERRVYLLRFFVTVKLTVREFFANRLNETLRLFYARFTQAPAGVTHEVQLLLDAAAGLQMAPSLEQFMDWFARTEAAVSAVLFAEHTRLPSDAFELLFPAGDCPDVAFIDDVRRSAAVADMRADAVSLIHEAYAHFAARTLGAAQFLLELQTRHAELGASEDYADAFVAVADEIADLLAEVDGLQRIVACGTLHADMKPAKTAALALMRETIERVREIGIARSLALYEQIAQVRAMYVKSIGMNRMMNITGETPDLIEFKQQMAALCAIYIPITESILTHWADSAIEIEEQYGSALDILTMITAAPSAKRRGRGRRRTGRDDRVPAHLSKCGMDCHALGIHYQC